MYRYRDSFRTTDASIARLSHLAQVGTVLCVKGYRTVGRHFAKWERVMVKGTNGKARYSGFCWGYGGAGPQGLVTLLEQVGLTRSDAEAIAFRAPRHDRIGVDWQVTFHPETGGYSIQTFAA